MTEHIDDAVATADFAEDVRRMLERRAADVPDRRPSDGPAPGGDVGRGGPGPTGWEASVVEPVVGSVAWHRRAGVLAAVAAVVAAAVGIGIATWPGEPDQQVAVGAAPLDGPTVLVPPVGDAFTLDWIDIPSGDEPGVADVATIEYGPADGDLTSGIAVIIEDTELGATTGGTLVASQQSETLAQLGAVFDGPAVVSWLDAGASGGGDIEPGDVEAPRSVTVLWYGQDLGQEQGLAVAAAVAADPALVLDGAPLPSGWEVRSTSEAGQTDDPSTWLAVSGPWSATLSSFPVALPYAIWTADWGYEGEAASYRQVEVRGGDGLLVERTLHDDDGGLIVVPSLVWREGGATHQYGLMEPATDRVDLIEGVERLVAVGLDEARRQAGRDDGADSTALTSVPMTTATTSTIVPPTTQTTGPAPTPTTGQPPFSLTAPGPGAIETPTPTTVGPGQTAAPASATTEGVPRTTEGADGATVTVPVTDPLRPPEGDFVTNAIVPVMSSTIGDQAYEVGVVWAPPFGFCMGVDLDGALLEGGFPVVCQPEPWIGGGGTRTVPGQGVLVFAFADAAVTSASLDLDGVTVEFEVGRVPAFPGFSLLVAAVDEASAPGLSSFDLPGAIALFDQAGQPVGWG